MSTLLHRDPKTIFPDLVNPCKSCSATSWT